jgi:hypothetical protein
LSERSEEFRRQAAAAGQKAEETASLTEAIQQRRRQKGLEQLAENEDWLDGKTKANDRS